MILDWRLGPNVPRIEIPRRFYCVATEPAPLAGMSRPRPGTPWNALAALGFRWIVCLESEAPDYDPSPLGRLLCVDLEDLECSCEEPPGDPEQERALIHRAVRATTERIMAREGTIVHCWGGSGRTGVVLGCVLRLLGHPGDEVVRHLRLLQRERGKSVWHDRAWQVELILTFQSDRL
ncbi:MAG: tyrosine-protein phosphatase [Thermoanaerobaculia bacterium]